MSSIRVRRGWLAAALVILILTLAAVVGIGGCATESDTGERMSASTTTAGAMTTTQGDEAVGAPSAEGAFGPVVGSGDDITGSLTALELAGSQKVISDAQLQIEVESGVFQSAFEQALLIADRYGGYIVSSGSQASGDEGSMKSGTIAIRVPAASFSRALSDADKLGDVKSRQIQTQDVTEEYVDLQARITNSQTHVKALLDLLARAKTVDEILQAQQVLTSAQQALEQLRGRLRFLDEHTSYSTIAMTIYETGAVVAPVGEWGITKAFKDALHNLVDAVNAIVRGLGVLIPVLVVLAIIAYVVYRIVLVSTRRRREREQARYQPYPQGWGGPAATQPGPAVQPGTAPHVTAEGPTTEGPTTEGPTV
ncbi:MAG: DUF4349 domain-containing protein [bacterium]